MKERLQKLISGAGLASRRKAEEWILEGRVRVNGKVVTELGSKADGRRDKITVNGKALVMPEPVYYLLNKPKGVVTTLSDPQGRRTIMEYLQKIRVRVYPIGRLDLNTEGLLLLTNDGALTHGLEHPSSEVEKEYEIRIKSPVSDRVLQAFRDGVRLADGMTAPATVETTGFDVKTGLTTLYVTIHEGRNRQIRRMCEHFGLRVHNLKRVRYAGLTLQGVKRGSYRKLTPTEVEELYACIPT